MAWHTHAHAYAHTQTWKLRRQDITQQTDPPDSRKMLRKRDIERTKGFENEKQENRKKLDIKRSFKR